MLIDKVHIFLSHSERYLKLSLWGFFVVYMVAFWCLQHKSLESWYAMYGFSRLSIICLFVVLSLLPYSLGHRLKVPTHYYAAIFCPSIVILTFTGADGISILSVVVGLLLVSILTFLVVRKPILRCRKFSSNVAILIALFVFSETFSDTNELHHYKHKISHLIDAGLYNEALKVGDESLNVDSAVFQQRVYAMLKSNSIGELLFKYPIPQSCATINTSKSLSSDNINDVLLCNLLLRKDLTYFAALVRQIYDINSPSLPRYYKEALIVYLSQFLSANITFSDSSAEANYKDFLAEMKKHTDPIQRSNYCRNLYGDTYFWYYFFYNSKH